MAFPAIDNTRVNAAKHYDDWYAAEVVAGKEVPYASLAAAHAAIPSAVRMKGRPFLVTIDGLTQEYWWKDDLTTAINKDNSLDKIPLAQKDKPSGVPSLASNSISSMDVVEGVIAAYKANTTVTPTQLSNYPEWYKELNTATYKRTDLTVTPNNFGAYGDGVYRPLSSVYATLSLAQAKYPSAVSLTDSIDLVAFQKAINFVQDSNGGTVSVLGNAKYNFNNGSVRVSKTNTHIMGEGGTVLNGEIGFIGASAGDQFHFKCEGFTISYDVTTVLESSDLYNGIVVQNVSRGRINNMFFYNCNADVYVKPTGIFQQTNRIAITNSESQYGNYGLKIADTPNTGNSGANQGDANFSIRSVGDFLMDNYTIQWKNYDQIYGNGVDGLIMNNVYCFSSPFNNANRPTKRCNLNLKNVTYCILSNSNLFEAGEDAIRLTDCDNITGSNLHLAWPGQRLASSGIKIIRTKNPTDVEVSFRFSNILIDTPTLNGITFEGDFATQMFSFLNISINKLGRSDRYYGGSAPYNNPSLGTYSHNTIYANDFVTGVIYEGSFDSEWITRGANLLGKGSFSKELNTRRGTYKYASSSDSAYDDLDIANYAGILENILPGSNNLSTVSQFTVLNSTISQLLSNPGPFGVGTIYRMTEDSVANTQKSISTATTLTKPSASDLAYTVSFYAKAAERQFLCLYVTNASFNNGIKIDYDILNASTGSIQRTDTDYKIIRTKIRKANNGFVRITLSYLSPAKHTTVRAAVYLKDKIQDVGNQSYIGDGVSGLFLSDFQISQTSVPLPYVLTTGTAVSQRANTGLPITATDVQNTQFKGASLVLTSARTLSLADYGKNGLLTIYADASGAAFQIVLVGAALDLGYTTKIVKTDSSANTVSVKGLGAELINNVNIDTSLSTQNASFILESNGTKHFKF